MKSLMTSSAHETKIYQMEEIYLVLLFWFK